MFKMILCTIIIVSCGTLGLIKSHTYNQRIRELDDIRDMLNMLNTEIAYRKDPLPYVFKRLSAYKNSKTSDLMQRCCYYMDGKYDLNKCWELSICDIYKNSSLTKEDKQILCDLSIQLGKSSLQGQQDLFKLMEGKILHQLNEAAAEKNSKGKMYGGLGFSIGIVSAVLLI